MICKAFSFLGKPVKYTRYIGISAITHLSFFLHSPLTHSELAALVIENATIPKGLFRIFNWIRETECL